MGKRKPSAAETSSAAARIPTPRPERREFRLHRNIIFHIIGKQAGTREKALLEGVMNSIDAGATRIEVSVGRAGFALADDGRGFESRQAIEDFFEQFGTPHEEGDARYGTFRIGRGQIFAFSSSVWRSGAFRMTVDVKENGAQYDLEEGLDPVEGCRIEGRWYDPLLPSEITTVVRQLRELCAYVSAPVLIDGRQANKAPAEEKWDLVTEDAYVRFRDTGGLRVYNLGVLVREYPAYFFGTAGIVVSRRQLKVNFARNDVLTNECEVWRRLAKLLRRKGGERAERKVRLSDDERKALALEFVHGERDEHDLRGLRLVTDATGRSTTLDSFRRHAALVTLAPEGEERLAEVVHTRKLAFVLARETLDRFDVGSAEELVALFARRAREWRSAKGWGEAYDGGWSSLKVVPFAAVAGGVDDAFHLLEDKELAPKMRAALAAVRDKSYLVADLIRRTGQLDHEVGAREIRAGRSEGIDAWTDGRAYIALSEDLLRHAADDGIEGFVDVAHALVHEYLHDVSSRGSHFHSPEFYEAYHAIVGDWRHKVVAHSARLMFLAYSSKLLSLGKRPAGRTAQDEDALASAEDRLAKVAARKGEGGAASGG